MMRCAVGRRLRAIESHLAAATTEVQAAPVVAAASTPWTEL